MNMSNENYVYMQTAGNNVYVNIIYTYIYIYINIYIYMYIYT